MAPTMCIPIENSATAMARIGPTTPNLASPADTAKTTADEHGQCLEEAAGNGQTGLDAERLAAVERGRLHGEQHPESDRNGAEHEPRRKVRRGQCPLGEPGSEQDQQEPIEQGSGSDHGDG